MSDIVTIGDATLYHGDCLEILPTLPQPEGEDLPAYTGALLARYQNPAIKHQILSIVLISIVSFVSHAINVHVTATGGSSVYAVWW